MSEPDHTGYRESPDTTDGPVAPAGEQVDQDAGVPPDEDATLTTDAAAQQEDSIMRPGNVPD